MSHVLTCLTCLTALRHMPLHLTTEIDCPQLRILAQITLLQAGTQAEHTESGKWDAFTRMHPQFCCIRGIREVKSRESRIL